MEIFRSGGLPGAEQGIEITAVVRIMEALGGAALGFHENAAALKQGHEERERGRAVALGGFLEHSGLPGMKRVPREPAAERSQVAVGVDGAELVQ